MSILFYQHLKLTKCKNRILMEANIFIIIYTCKRVVIQSRFNFCTNFARRRKRTSGSTLVGRIIFKCLQASSKFVSLFLPLQKLTFPVLQFFQCCLDLLFSELHIHGVLVFVQLNNFMYSFVHGTDITSSLCRINIIFLQTHR